MVSMITLTRLYGGRCGPAAQPCPAGAVSNPTRMLYDYAAFARGGKAAPPKAFIFMSS